MTKKNEKYPVLPLRDIVVYPKMIVPLFVGRDKSIRALQEVVNGDQNIVLVTNEIFSDGISYDETTTAYQQKLGEINCGLAKLADAVVEVVCGIPLIRKDQTAILKELTTE